jgi:hypothetical protein
MDPARSWGMAQSEVWGSRWGVDLAQAGGQHYPSDGDPSGASI